MAHEEFDAVVVGSGFGGAVSCYRLAQAGWKVCLLERGRRWPPGSFARTPAAFGKNFWDPSERQFGLFDIWSFKRLDAVVGSGLGGGSLIYANVLIRKDEKWFVREPAEAGHHRGHREYWPVQRADLERHYDEVEQVLRPVKYPLEHPHFDHIVKTRALLRSGRAVGLEAELLPLAVTFGNDPQRPLPGEQIQGASNLHGLPRSTCRLCGECFLGCNFGSKNTLDMNYLSMAERLGAELRDLSEVTSLRRADSGGGFELQYVRHQPDEERPRGYRPEPRTLRCKKLVMAAGTVGSSYLLLKHRDALGLTSPMLGEKVGGNGDALMFATGCRDEQGRAFDVRADLGPTITAAIRRGDALDGDGASGRGAYVEEASVPAFLSWLGEFALPWKVVPNLARFAWLAWRSRRRDADMSYEVSQLLGDARLSSGLLPLLCMGRDVADGRFSLSGKWLDCDWSAGASQEFFDSVRGIAAAVADKLGGRLVENPAGLLGRSTTVHPLGGCTMGDDAGSGAVDPWGRAFGAEDLVVADGSVMPGATGPNPSLTIAALANRFAEHLVEAGRPR